MCDEVSVYIMVNLYLIDHSIKPYQHKPIVTSNKGQSTKRQKFRCLVTLFFLFPSNPALRDNARRASEKLLCQFWDVKKS